MLVSLACFSGSLDVCKSKVWWSKLGGPHIPGQILQIGLNHSKYLRTRLRGWIFKRAQEARLCRCLKFHHKWYSSKMLRVLSVFKTTYTKKKLFVLVREERIWKIILYLQTLVPGNVTANTPGLIVQYIQWNPILPTTNRELQVLCILPAEKVYLPLLSSFLDFTFQNLSKTCFSIQNNVQANAFSLLV